VIAFPAPEKFNQPPIEGMHMATRLEVMLSPAEFGPLKQRDLRGAVAIVFDILRATTSMVTALYRGAEAIIPVEDIPEALAIRRERPEVLLAGERHGLRIRAPQTGGIDFDFGNSPREFTAERVRGRTIVMTTTNGTRGLGACAGADTVLVSSFLNLRATAQWLQARAPAHLVVLCSGTFDEAALEDILAAGALCEKIWPMYSAGHIADSAEVARRLYPVLQGNLTEAMRHALNGRRLLANPDLRDDVNVSLQRETIPFAAHMDRDGAVRLIRS
jgi:2-phosphosulfolactate phosphatase